MTNWEGGGPNPYPPIGAGGGKGASTNGGGSVKIREDLHGPETCNYNMCAALEPKSCPYIRDDLKGGLRPRPPFDPAKADEAHNKIQDYKT
jgi:hypothetical protein